MAYPDVLAVNPDARANLWGPASPDPAIALGQGAIRQTRRRLPLSPQGSHSP